MTTPRLSTSSRFLVAALTVLMALEFGSIVFLLGEPEDPAIPAIYTASFSSLVLGQVVHVQVTACPARALPPDASSALRFCTLILPTSGPLPGG